MNQRELSEKLEKLAVTLEDMAEGNDYFSPASILSIAEELRKLSNENYAPGNTLSWDAVKPKPVKKPNGFFSKGKKLPF